MAQTILMFAAATNLIAVACFITTARIFHIILYQLAPAIIAFGLGMFALARVMGWPL